MRPTFDNGVVRLYESDARTLPLSDGSVHCVVTSPPYFGLRDYGLEPSIWGGDSDHKHEWGEPIRGKSQSGSLNGSTLQGASPGSERRPEWESQFCNCGAWLGGLGLEPTPDLFIEHLVLIMREVRRVLRDDGTLWLNLGDSYASDGKWGGSTGGKHATQLHGGTGVGRGRRQTGLKHKDLVGIPWRTAIALQSDGWYLRRDVVWSKANPMPESVTDRPSTAHEYLFMLTKEPSYYYDAEAVKEPAQDWGARNRRQYRNGTSDAKLKQRGMSDGDFEDRGRNRRSVWDLATQPFGFELCESCGKVYRTAQYRRLPKVTWQVWNPETEQHDEQEGRICNRCGERERWLSHFAVFPEKLVEPCILSGSSGHGVCSKCGAPWKRGWTSRLTGIRLAPTPLTLRRPRYWTHSRAQGLQLSPPRPSDGTLSG